MRDVGHIDVAQHLQSMIEDNDTVDGVLTWIVDRGLHISRDSTAFQLTRAGSRPRKFAITVEEMP